MYKETTNLSNPFERKEIEKDVSSLSSGRTLLRNKHSFFVLPPITKLNRNIIAGLLFFGEATCIVAERIGQKENYVHS